MAPTVPPESITTTPDTPTPSISAPPRRAELWWALGGALVLAMLYGRLLVLHLTDGVVGGDIDAYESAWNYYWLKTALFDLHQNPFYATYIYYPTGVSLYFHTFNPINGLLMMPINLTFGYVVGMNLLFLGLLTAGTFCAYLFLRDWVGNGWAAFAGAALYTYGNRLVVEYFKAGQPERLGTEWFPLFLFFAYRALFGSRRWGLWAALAVLTLLAESLADWQYVMVTVFVTLLLFAYLLTTRRTRREKLVIFGKLAAIGGAYAVLITPLLIPTVQDALANPWLSVGYQSSLHSTDLRELLGPGIDNPGYLVLGAALFGLAVAWRGPGREFARFWALVTLVFYVMSLGPTLLWGGQDTGIPLPYGLLQNLPVFSIGRDPVRYLLAARLGIGVLTAFGVRAVLTWAQARWVGRSWMGGPLWRVAVAGAVAVFLALSLGGYALAAGAAKVDRPDVPPFFEQLAHDPDDYAILELPLFTENGRGEDHYQMYQVIHHKPRFGGRYARDHKLTNPNNFVKTTGLFRDLWLLDAPPAQRENNLPAKDFLTRTDYSAQGLAILNYYKVGYIVVYKDALTPEWRAGSLQRILTEVFGGDPRPVYEDDQIRAYKVPSGPPARDPLTLDTGDGWGSAEVGGDGAAFRWADPTPHSQNGPPQPSEIYTSNLRQQPTAATLHFTAFAFDGARTVQVSLNGAPLTTLHLTPESGPQSPTLDLTLPPGRNILSFSSPEPSQPTGNPADARLLSFGLRDVTLTAK